MILDVFHVTLVAVLALEKVLKDAELAITVSS